MKLVIEINDEMYNVYKDKPPMLGDVGIDSIVQAIANGTPLPKGHGRLKDTDVICKHILAPESLAYLKSRDAVSIINSAPTIIEADSEVIK